MSNLVEFVVKVRDQVRAGLQSAVGSSKSAFGDMNKGIGSVNSNIDKAKVKTAEYFGSVKSGAKGATEQIKKMNDELSKSGSKKGGAGIGSIFKGSYLGSLASNATMAAASFVGGQVMDVKNRGLEIGKTKTQLNVLAGERDGTALFKDLQKYIKDSVFGPELYDNARTMLGYGIPANKVMPTTRMLGDISMGDGEKLKSLTLAYAQVRGKGTLQGQEKNQMIEAGYNPLADIVAITGKSMAQVSKDMEKGLIGFDLVEKAMLRATGAGGKFNGMLDKIGKTPYGLEQQMSGTIEDVKASFGEKLMPLYMRMLTGLTPLVDRLPAILDRVIPAFEKVGAVVSELYPPIVSAAKAIYGAFAPLITSERIDKGVGIIKSLISMASSIATILSPAINLLGQLFEGIASVLAPVLSFLADKLGWIANQTDKVFGQKANSAPALVAQNSFDMFKGIVPSKRLPQLSASGDISTLMAPTSATTDPTKAKEANDAIIGGGKKSITFNINHELVRQIITTSGAADTFKAGKEALTEEIFRLFGAGAAATI
jgi:tape measure domain-containing protein